MILFIASIVVAASVVGVFTDSISRVSEAIDQRGISVSENVRTDIEIISDSGSDAVYRETGDSNHVVVHVKNTGSETLTAESGQMDVFVNGTYQSDVNVTLLGGASSWRPGEVAEVNITAALGSGDHRVKVIINEDEEVFEFNT
jgi:flagellar protein FlaG